MPRPKRTKIAPSAPTPVAIISAPQNHISTDVSPRPSGRTTTNSDDSEGIVKTIKNGLRRKSTIHDDVSMSGALAPQDVQNSARLRPPGGRQRAALSRIARDGDHARAIEALKKRRDEAMSEVRAPKVAQQVSALETTLQLPDQVLVPMSLPKAVERAVSKTVEEEQEDLLVDTRTVKRVRPVPFSSRKIPPALGTESSIVGLANFRRRPRQPSILQIGRQESAASERELDDMLDDFQPDDESTPVHITRLQTRIGLTPGHLDTTTTHYVPASSSWKRKLTSPEIQVANFQSSPIQVPSSPPQVKNTSIHSPAFSIHPSPHVSETESLPEVPLISSSEAIWSDIMAPPQSSSPLQSPLKAIQVANATKTSLELYSKSQRKSFAIKIDSNRYSAAMQTKPKQQPLTSISTATLQNLLPRRRHHPARCGVGDFDIPNSSDVESDTLKMAEDEDELSFAAPPGRRRADNATYNSVKSTKLTVTMRKKQVKSKAKATSKERANGLGVVKTYLRRVSDKENISTVDLDGEGQESNEDQLPDGSNQHNETGHPSAISPVKVKTELKALARKFKEVDRWEMEFEEVTASSSSPWDGR